MERLLKPATFDTDHTSPDATKQWKHFFRTFQNFTTEINDDPSRLKLLINHISPDVYQLIEDSQDYAQAIRTLKKLYVKTPNVIYARHLLATRRQKEGETLDTYLQALKDLSKDCNYEPVTAVQHRDESIRDSFIAGIRSNQIRQRLLENAQLDLDNMVAQARALDSAQKSNASYQTPAFEVNAISNNSEAHSMSREQPVFDYQQPYQPTSSTNQPTSAAAFRRPNHYPRCNCCGYNSHDPRDRNSCPAKDELCHKCQKIGHFQKVCRSSRKKSSTAAAAFMPTLGSVIAATEPLRDKSKTSVTLAGDEFSGLVDTGAEFSFVHPKVVQAKSLRVYPGGCTVSMANTSFHSKSMGVCREKFTVRGHEYQGLELSILPDLCADVILGKDLLKLHEPVTFEYGGSLPPLVEFLLPYLSLNIQI